MRRFVVTGLLFFLFGSTKVVLADSYTFTMIVAPGYPIPTYQNQVLGINNNGQVVGNAGSHGFIYSSGHFTTIDYPNAHQTNPIGLNNAGQIVGWYLADDSSLSNHGFLYSGGNFTSIDYPNAIFTSAYGINDTGQIVGAYYDGSMEHGFVYSGGNFSSIDFPNATLTYLTGINNTGQIVGNYWDASGNHQSHGFLYSSGNFITIDVPNVYQGAFTGDVLALGINNSGEIVGYYLDADGHYRGFLDSGGKFTPIDYPTAGNTFAYGINDSGHISGYAAANNVGTYGFLATPDKTPPVISGMPAAGCTLWPPNGKMVRVATVTASDALSGLAPGSFTVTGTSNEPPSAPEISITPNGSGGFIVQLQADRFGTGTGRIYALTATARDLAGNAATVTATCTVPHDQGR